MKFYNKLFPFAFFLLVFLFENGIVYAAYETKNSGATGISYFLMSESVGGASTSHWDIENSYQNSHMILKTITRISANNQTLFIGIDNINRLWFSRGGQWAMHGETSIGDINKIRFDATGILYLMTESEIYKTSIPLE